MERTFLLFLTSFLIIFLIRGDDDYCDIQAKLCEQNVTHINCQPDEFDDEIQNFHEVTITRPLRKIILSRLSSVRDQYANETNVANMKMVGWDYDLQKIAENLNLKVKNDKICIATKENPKPFYWTLYLYSESTNKAAAESAMGLLTIFHYNTTILNNNNKVGCAILRLKDGHKTTCVLPVESKADGFEDNVIYGEPCSKCSTDDVCNDLYRSLCGPPKHMDFYNRYLY